jgi:hypothetical protein
MHFVIFFSLCKSCIRALPEAKKGIHDSYFALGFVLCGMETGYEIQIHNFVGGTSKYTRALHEALLNKQAEHINYIYIQSIYNTHFSHWANSAFYPAVIRHSLFIISDKNIPSTKSG